MTHVHFRDPQTRQSFTVKVLQAGYVLAPKRKITDWAALQYTVTAFKFLNLSTAKTHRVLKVQLQTVASLNPVAFNRA